MPGLPQNTEAVHRELDLFNDVRLEPYGMHERRVASRQSPAVKWSWS
jgi:hypothetical protein